MTEFEESNPVYPLLECRLITFDVLKQTFLVEPTLEFLSRFQKEDLADIFPFASESEYISKGVNCLENFISSNDLSSKTVHNDLHWDYTRMFIGPYELPAPPWESVYLNEERLLFQEGTLNVRRAYLKYFFLPKDFGHEADDHLGLELDFMFQLTKLAIDELKIGNFVEYHKILEDQKAFLEEHLLKWVPAFSEKVVESAHTDFYRGMALILKGFLLLDLKALYELLDILP
jgi:TorA maturation chaperone TorD